MSRTLIRRAVVVPVLLLALAGAASGDVIVTNLAEPLRGTTDVGNNPNPVPPPPPVKQWSWAAQGFVTDARSYSLTKIDIIAGNAAANPVVVARLHADNGTGQIGAVITDLIAPSMDGPLSIKTLTPATPVTLAPSTLYWVVIGPEAPGDGTFGMSYANTNLFEGVGNIGPYADSQDSGVNWNYGTIAPYYIQVIGEPTVSCGGCPGDADGNLTVNFTDITTVLANFGTTCK